MAILSLQNIKIEFGMQTLFENLSWQIEPGEKWGFIGGNGAGKTSLFQAVLGNLLPKEGSIVKKIGLQAGYLAQHAPAGGNATPLEELYAVMAPVTAMEAALRAMEKEMSAAGPEELERLGHSYDLLLTRYENAGGYEIESRIYGVLNGLSLPKALWNNPCATLSGGERTRLGLAKLLLNPPELLLLDEPTNHLDMRAAAWLADYLKTLKCALIVISHDRYLLDQATSKTARLEHGRLYQYTGNYSRSKDLHLAAMDAYQKQYAGQQKEIARQEDIIRRFHQTNTEKSVKLARSREKALDRMDRLDKPAGTEEMRLRFAEAPRPGREILRARGLSRAFDGRVLYSGLSLSLQAGERTALIGPNGSGKTTLLFELMQNPAARFGTGARIGFYSQHQSELNPQDTVLDAVWEGNRTLTRGQVMNALAAMLFKGEEAEKRISALSGGERARAALCRLALSPTNVLLLDEPTNHLDMPSKEIFEEALAKYTGTVIAVSHDRYFIDRIATRLWALEEGIFTDFNGGYEEYLRANSPAAPAEAAPVISKTERARTQKLSRAQKEEKAAYERKAKETEAELARLEARIAQLEDLFSRPETYENTADLPRLQEEYALCKARWEEVFLQLSN